MPRRQGWFAAIATIVTGLGSFALTASPAAAGDPVADARARLEEAQSAAAAAADRYEGTLAERDATQQEVVRLEQEIVTVRDGITLLKARRAVLKELVNERAAELYRNGTPSDVLGALEDSKTAGRRRKLGESAIEADLANAEELAQTTGELEAKQTALDTQRAQLEQKRAELDALIVRLDGEKAEFEAKVAVADAALEKAEALGALLASGTPVLGQSVLTAADLAGWYRTTDATPHLADGLTIDGLAALFIEEGAAESVRGDVAFAQAYLETGGFDFPGHGQVSVDDNNFAGLGACDSCSTGRRFPTARDGVRAQIQHLRNYADEQSSAAALANPPSPYWYGPDPGTAARNFDTFYAKGWAPIWEMMGKGKWATDPNYAGKVIGLYERMATHAIGG
ncbi:MAG: glucosaminidase domain-containing protein [Actinomycetota bacterium]